MQNEVYVCVMNENEPQDSTTNVAIMNMCFSAFSKSHPWIKQAWIRSDNAGTYHSENTIRSLWTKQNEFNNMKIMGYKFATSGMFFKFITYEFFTFHLIF